MSCERRVPDALPGAPPREPTEFRDIDRRVARVAACVLGVLGMLLASVAVAHDSRPLAIELAEHEDGLFTLSWRVPPVMPIGTEPRIALVGPSCRAVARDPSSAPADAGLTGRSMHSCPRGLDGHVVVIEYPVINPSLSTLLRVEWRSGERRVFAATPSESRITLPARAEASRVARSYFVLGVQHILAGPDHLLFLACLLWIAATPRRLVLAITGFTIGHSVTLSLATLDVVRVPVAPMEACIALSVMFLAAELARGRQETIVWRFPLAAALIFGLLHGFGFASVLSEIGTPQGQLVVALLFFNMGVEIGQLLFGGIALALAAAWRQTMRVHAPALVQAEVVQRRLPLVFGYGVGVVAAWWFVDRTARMVV